MFKCAKISLFKLSLRREFKTLRQFSFACFKLLDSFSSKSDLEKLQHEVLPDNCQLKTFEICCVKLLLRMLAPFLFTWSLTYSDELLYFCCCDQWRKSSFCYTFPSNDGWLYFPFYWIHVISHTMSSCSWKVSLKKFVFWFCFFCYFSSVCVFDRTVS